MYNIICIGCIVCVYIGKVGAECSYWCYDNWRGDGWCDSACDNDACNYDDGDCGSSTSCSFMCSDSQLGDGTCDYWCNVSNCNYDDGDFGSPEDTLEDYGYHWNLNGEVEIWDAYNPKCYESFNDNNEFIDWWES